MHRSAATVIRPLRRHYRAQLHLAACVPNLPYAPDGHCLYLHLGAEGPLLIADAKAGRVLWNGYPHRRGGHLDDAARRPLPRLEHDH